MRGLEARPEDFSPLLAISNSMAKMDKGVFPPCETAKRQDSGSALSSAKSLCLIVLFEFHLQARMNKTAKPFLVFIVAAAAFNRSESRLACCAGSWSSGSLHVGSIVVPFGDYLIGSNYTQKGNYNGAYR